MSGCGHYYGFGIRSDSSALKFKQTDKYETYRKYEFQSVLFEDNDRSFKIILQHPIYPLATPDVLISQVGIISENKNPADFKFTKIEIGHFDQSGKLITPSKTMAFHSSARKDFHVVKYKRDLFPKKQVREKVKVEFTVNGESHVITFDEDVFWVKRVSKWSAWMSI